MSVRSPGNRNCSTGKRGFPDRAAAKKVARKNTPQGRKLSFYQCGECGKWHVTKWKGKAEVAYRAPRRSDEVSRRRRTTDVHRDQG